MDGGSFGRILSSLPSFGSLNIQLKGVVHRTKTATITDGTLGVAIEPVGHVHCVASVATCLAPSEP